MKNIIKYITVLVLGLSLLSCDKIFDSLEGDLTKMYQDDMLATVNGIDRLIANIYVNIPQDAFSTLDKSTMDATDTHGAAYGINATSFWNYTNMRAVNLLIPQLDEALNKNVLTKEQHDYRMGEVLFVRAYYYFAMVRTRGGVPIVTEPLDDKYDGNENKELYVPRSTEKATWDFVLDELDKAAALLPTDANAWAGDTYRATKWSALGLKVRAALYAASVSKYWNKAPIANTFKAVEDKLTYMESSYANDYYKACLDAAEAIINSGKFKLYGGATTSVEAAKKNFTDLFMGSGVSDEMLFGKSYEFGTATASNGFDYPNSPSQGHAHDVAWQWGRYSVTLDLADAFDNYNAEGGRADGTIKTRVDGVENEYVVNLVEAKSLGDTDYIKYDDLQDPFVNKDARFQSSVIYPGTTFRGLKIIIQGGIRKTDGSTVFYGPAEETFNGKKYYTFGAPEANNDQFSGFYLMDDGNAGNWYNTGFGIAKFLDPTSSVIYSKNPWFDIRYAEILLSYAEAYAESKQGNAELAKKCLNDVRHRAAFTDDIEPTVENVLHERRVELAFENDLPYTLARRREYVFGAENATRKHALVPVIDLSGAEAKYIFVRGNVKQNDQNVSASGLYISDYRNYYGSIPDYQKNGLIPNPIQQ